MNDRMLELVVMLSIAGIFFAWRWWTVWRMGQLSTSLAQLLADSQKPPPRLDPESKFIIHLSDDSISCQRPDGTIEQVVWEDLQRVEILTTTDGPMLPDTFWVLHGTNSGCVIPWGATGGHELLERLQQLPQFDNLAVIGSSGRIDDSLRLCWRRSSESEEDVKAPPAPPAE